MAAEATPETVYLFALLEGTGMVEYWSNSHLFSNHYLRSLVQRNPEWTAAQVRPILHKVQEVFDREKERLPRLTEPQLEEIFIRPILKILGHSFAIQGKVERGLEKPDYGFFLNTEAANRAYKRQGKEDFYKDAIAIGDAKQWNIQFDRQKPGLKAYERRNPSFQIDYYLRETPPVRWAILTNGRLWRLYARETSYKLDSFYEFDLDALLSAEPSLEREEAFKYFLLFFGKEAFIPGPGPGSRSFLDRVYQGSIDYAKKLGDSLKENVYQAMRHLARGFFEWPGNKLEKNPGNLQLVQDNTMKLLYRLLFVFYAESRGLLDLSKPEYARRSLDSLKKEIAESKKRGDAIFPATSKHWNSLEDLFRLINEGSEAFGIRKEDLFIPPYNGGLFDPVRNPFLSEKKVGDFYLAEAIDLLARAKDDDGVGFVDYSTLGIRQLGSIYEGYLENHLEVASEDMVAVREKGREVWLPKSKAGADKVADKVARGELYLRTDKGERKATGSYYTPDYIVKYIVRHTLEPVVKQKIREWRDKKIHLPAWKVLLEIKVLDPAMGSGHFLVEAIDYLANHLIRAHAEMKPGEVEEEELAGHDVHWARREVARHCIFGVDLNPMAVELAKLSLWLETVAANKPLTFLDHHLKCGNSLIGAKVGDLAALPRKEGKKSKGEKKKAAAPAAHVQATIWESQVSATFKDLLRRYAELVGEPDDDLRAVKEKEKKFGELQRSALNKRLHELANIWVSTYFGNEVPEGGYVALGNALADEAKWREAAGSDWFKRAQQMAEEKRFFHWPLEFPEALGNPGETESGGPGFHSVIGNPPYVRQEQLKELKPYLKECYKETYDGVADLYVYFFQRAHAYLRKQGRFAFISSNKFMRAGYGQALRNFLNHGFYIEQIADFRDLPVFPDATAYPCIVLTENVPRGGRKTLYASIPSLDFVDGGESLEAVVERTGDPLPETAFGDAGWSLGSAADEAILRKMEAVSVPLKDYVKSEINRGVLTGLNEAFFIDRETRDRFIREDPKSAELIKPLVVGEDVKRYEIEYKERYLLLIPSGWTKEKSGKGVEEEAWHWLTEEYPAVASHMAKFEAQLRKRWDKGERWWELRSCDYYADFEKPKIIYQEIAISSAFAFSDSPLYANNKCFILPTADLYLIALLNSKLIWFKLSRTVSKLRGDTYAMQTPYVFPLPIRKISSNTPEGRRKKLLADAKNAVSRYLESGGIEAPLDFVSARLSASPEEADVVRDLLAHLAEQMLEMNREKQEEARSFLRWLQTEIRADIEDLNGKTILREYWGSTPEQVIEVLKKNGKKLAIEPRRREFQDEVREEMEKSMKKLGPLLQRIQATDWLIDQIVYRLYGITDEERKIIEGQR